MRTNPASDAEKESLVFMEIALSESPRLCRRSFLWQALAGADVDVARRLVSPTPLLTPDSQREFDRRAQNLPLSGVSTGARPDPDTHGPTNEARPDRSIKSHSRLPD